MVRANNRAVSAVGFFRCAYYFLVSPATTIDETQ